MNESSGNWTTLDEQAVAELLQQCTIHERAILGVLAVAEQNRLPAAPMVSKLATDLPSSHRYRAYELADLLHDGQSIEQALKSVPGVVPPQVILAIYAAKERGMTSRFFSAISNRKLDRTSDQFDSLGGASVSRFFIRNFFVFWIFIFFLLKIVPEFKKMADEFGLELPALFKQLLYIFYYCSLYWFFGLLALLLIAIPAFPYIRHRLRRFNPSLWRHSRQAASSIRLQLLAWAAKVQSKENLVTRVLDLFPNDRSSIQLQKVREAIESGTDTWDALAKYNVITRRDSQALGMTQSAETQSWLLQRTASKKQNRGLRRSAVHTQMIITFINVAVAFLILMTAASIFLFLISLMKGLG